MEIYRYTTRDGWTLAMGPRLPEAVANSDDLGAWLFEQGYKQMAQSGVGRCYVGHFVLWQQEQRPLAGDPLYAIEIDQIGAESVVWIEMLPDLWEFLATYSGIGASMAWPLPGEEDEEDEEDEGPHCPDCGEPLMWVPKSANDKRTAPEWDA